MLKPLVYLDLSSFIEVKLVDLNSKIKMVGSKNDPIIWVNTQKLNHRRKNSEYGQEIPQSQTLDKPMAS